jgi:hypothetical protein
VRLPDVPSNPAKSTVPSSRGTPTLSLKMNFIFNMLDAILTVHVAEAH